MSSAGAGSALQVHAIRVRPGQELLGTLQAFVEEKRLRAPFIVTCVGSLTKATLRLANDTATKTNEVVHLSGPFEIVSLVGTLNPDAHIHISLSDFEGKTVGGHVLGDLEVFTTAEVVIGEAVDLEFTREMDEQTGFPELVVQPRPQTNQSA
ncbi:bifunctional protein GlmU [Haplochromis burtoni]|uniref:Bifunctional protein GlmU-like n=1 Tax=Haplochromis burtoni TaxID=8153 RepID=A0A3Q2UZP9_HAPBU|nr:bifunctional protein GlmU [Haplochromis burtoni]